MLRILDKNKPYAEIHGLPGAMYEQNGIMFKGDLTEALSTEPFLEEALPPEDISEPPVVFCIEQKTEPHDFSDGKTIFDMHWKPLKLLVESYGGEWTNRASAIEFLKGRK